MIKLVDIIAGARPNFIKINPIIKELDRVRAEGSALRYRLIHTGQHYDRSMSGNFFEQLGIPDPYINLAVGSGSQAFQTGQIMLGYEKVLEAAPSDVCLVVGDVTSTMACAIVARKAGIPVAHVEGGLRSGDWTMPEEVNRVVTDAITNWFFTTSVSAGDNLLAQGVAPQRIFFTGNVMIDTLMAQLPHLRPPEFWTSMALAPKSYFVVTLHRPANVDDPEKLQKLLAAIAEGTQGMDVIFPVHPRTKSMLQSASLGAAHFKFVDPLGYQEFNYLVKHSKAVITDSGGVTEETTVLGVPCLTLRDNTERPETVTLGTNELIGTDPRTLGPALARVRSGNWKSGSVPERWDGMAASRVVQALESVLRTP